MDIKLKKLIEDFALDHERPKVDKFKVTEAIRNYAKVGKALYQSGGILEAAKQLSEMATAAQNHVLGETNDWFDSVSVKRNMKELKGLTGQFKKTAVEANAVNQRLSALYEDMGNILNRYYEIDEAMDKVDKDELDGDYEDREDKDIDNDGDTDDSDEYLHKKRQAISKAIKKQKGVNEDLDSQIDALMKQKEKLMVKRPVPHNDVARIQGKINVLRDKKAKEKERNENISKLGDFLPNILKEFGPSPMDAALKQKLKDPKSGKEVTIGSIKNQGEKRYDSALVKKANAIFKKAMEKEMATKKKIRKMQGD